MQRLLRNAPKRQAAPASIKRAAVATSRPEVALTDHWPPGWGLLSAFLASAFMWWSILQALRILAAALFMS
jgi:hypothetical protein